MLRNIEDRIQHLEIGQADVATLLRQAMLDTLKLDFGDFHLQSIESSSEVLTGPRNIC